LAAETVKAETRRCPSSVVLRPLSVAPKLRPDWGARPYHGPTAFSLVPGLCFLGRYAFRPRFVTARQVPSRYGCNLLLNMGEIRGCLRLPLVRCPVLGLRCTKAVTIRRLSAFSYQPSATAFSL